MSTAVIIILAILTFLTGGLALVFVLVLSLIGWLLCNIHPGETYSWYSGIWHGLFFLPNYIRHLIWGVPFKAELYTTAYNVFYWIFSILSTASYLLGIRPPRNRF